MLLKTMVTVAVLECPKCRTEWIMEIDRGKVSLSEKEPDGVMMVAESDDSEVRKTMILR